MANLITVTALSDYVGQPLSASIGLPVNVFRIQDAVANSTSGITNVNTTLNVLYHDGNSTRLGSLLVFETPAAIVTASNAALA